MDHPTLSSEGPWFLKAWCLESTTSRSRCTLLNLDDCLANLGEDVSSFSQSCNNCSVDPVRAWEINCKCEPDTSQRAYFDLNAVIANWDGTLGCYDITAPECPENITAEYWRAMPIVSSQ
ncbi:hypothetical protein MGN70_010450 [Eutypa lata]|nr:hypothetical protein MGN70_010450 [Eutypa lata]